MLYFYNIRLFYKLSGIANFHLVIVNKLLEMRSYCNVSSCKVLSIKLSSDGRRTQ